MSESGEYRCLAGNVLGETSSSIHLQINKSERARIHWTIFGLILFYAMAEKWAFVMIKIMKTSFLLKMAVAVTPLHSMLTSILSPLTVLLTTVVTPCLRTCDNVTSLHTSYILFLLVSGGPYEGLWVLQKVKNTCDSSQICTEWKEWIYRVIVLIVH